MLIFFDHEHQVKGRIRDFLPECFYAAINGPHRKEISNILLKPGRSGKPDNMIQTFSSFLFSKTNLDTVTKVIVSN